MIKILKNNITRRRPNSFLKYNSFPSRHTAISYCGAQLLCYQADANYYEKAAINLIAAATGALRLYRRKHWLSDVIAGVVIGIVSAKVAYSLSRKL